METGLIEALAKAAQEAREEKGVSKEQIAVEVGQGVDSVRRFENATVFRALNDLYEAYSVTTGKSLSDLLDDAKPHLKTKG